MARKILVIDDDYSFAEFAKMLLEMFGYTVKISLNAIKIVDLAISEKPDLIIMDINMPEINGIEAVKILKSNRKTAKIPILMCSMSNNKTEVSNSLSFGALDFIRKPLEQESLKTAVDKIFQKQK